jgi:hypothetical protein
VELILEIEDGRRRDFVGLRDAVVGWTPAHWAVCAGHESAARIMIDRTGGGGGSQTPDERLEELRRDVRGVEEADVAVFRGRPWHAKIGRALACPQTTAMSEDDAVEFVGAFSTVRAKRRCPPGAKGYYEIEIVELDSLPQLGFAAAAFERVRGKSGDGVGDDGVSWGVDGVRQRKWHKGEDDYPFEWKAGDVVGLACDLEAMQVLVSVNGSFDAPNGRVFELDAGAAEGGLFPALTGSSGAVRCNLGARPFRHAPPSAAFKAFVDFDGGDADSTAAAAQAQA